MSSKKKSNNRREKRPFLSDSQNNHLKEMIHLAYQLLKLFFSFLKAIFLFLFSVFPTSFRYVSNGFQKLGNLFRFSLSFKMGFMYSLMFTLIFSILNLLLLFGAKFILYNQGEKNFDFASTEAISKFQNALDLDALNFDDISQKYSSTITLISNEKEQITQSKSTPTPKHILDLELGLGPNDLERIYVLIKNDQRYFLQLIHPMDFEREILVLILLVGCSISFLGLILTINISGALAKKLLNPINQMTEDANQISAKDLSKRLDVKESKDELKDLSMAFNQLLDNIEESYQKQRSFVSDASHELRTPLAIIQGYADLLHRWGKENPSILEESIDAIKSETKDMQTLVEQLLFLSRSDEKRLNFDFHVVDFREQMESICSEFKRLDLAHYYSCSHTGSNFTIIADDSAIRQLLRIFLDNAKKYTPSEGQIKVILSSYPSNVCLTISDSGIGIDPEDLPHIFDRFYRADKARRREGGKGLGLSIAKEIIKLHNGRIDVKSQKDLGTTIHIEFPLASPES